MTRGTGSTAAANAADGFARDWRALRASSDIQFAQIDPPAPSQTPEWLIEIGRFIARLMTSVGDALAAIARLFGVRDQVFAWGLIAVAALVILWLVWRMVDARRRRRAPPAPASEEWAPEAGEALALLEDADRLAALGRYDEAVHLLLQRSIVQIAAARPGWLAPSSTAREIAALPALAAPARAAFAAIAAPVERSLFALRRLDADDWKTARAAYADFALAAPQ